MKIGIDIVEHHRFETEKINLISRILSDYEKDVFNNITDKKRQINYVSSRFAAKEAIFKAYQEGDKTFNYKDITIKNRPSGAPFVECEKIKEQINLSISHSENYSIAMVVIPD